MPLELPESAPGRLFVILGSDAGNRAAAGRALAEALTKSIFLDGAALAEIVVAGRMPMTQTPTVGALEQLYTRYAGAITLAEVYRANSFDAVVTDDVVGDQLDDFLDLAEPGPVHLVVLHPDAEAMRNRAEPTADKVEYRWNELEFNTTRVGLWIDDTSTTPAQLVVRILRNLDEARVDPADLTT